MRWEERLVPVHVEVDVEPELWVRVGYAPRIVPSEWCLYTCDCGVTVGPASVVEHLMAYHTEGASGELLEEIASMVRPARLARSDGERRTTEYEPHPNAGLRPEPASDSCESVNQREWCHGPDAERATLQCSECFQTERGEWE